MSVGDQLSLAELITTCPTLPRPNEIWFAVDARTLVCEVPDAAL